MQQVIESLSKAIFRKEQVEHNNSQRRPAWVYDQA